ncbi:hypothetical protein AB0O57_29685 [Streptomyces sp. NPDC091201]|uniref:hypothetical protein n=1 Tax=Streptomyces sp. NPDC091201 TaxID=3155190 RepID=UPI003434EA9D
MASKTASRPYQPAPGTEHPFSIGDIAFAAARILGDGFAGDSGQWGVTGLVHGLGDTWVVEVDHDGDLALRPSDDFEAIHYFTDLSVNDGLDNIAAAVAEAIRANIVYILTHPLKDHDET